MRTKILGEYGVLCTGTARPNGRTCMAGSLFRLPAISGRDFMKDLKGSHWDTLPCTVTTGTMIRRKMHEGTQGVAAVTGDVMTSVGRLATAGGVEETGTESWT